MNKTTFRPHHIAIPALAVAAISALGFALAPVTPAVQAAPAAQAAAASGPTAIPLDYVSEPVATPAAKLAVRRAPNSIAGAITLTVRSDVAADTQIPNWSVVVSELSSGVSMTGATSASGDIVLWLATGNYKACEILPAGYVNVYPGDGCYWITLTDIGEASLLFRNAPVMPRTVETDTLSLNFGNVHPPAFSPTPAP